MIFSKKNSIKSKYPQKNSCKQVNFPMTYPEKTQYFTLLNKLSLKAFPNIFLLILLYNWRVARSVTVKCGQDASSVGSSSSGSKSGLSLGGSVRNRLLAI